jgi:hypothetical protein
LVSERGPAVTSPAAGPPPITDAMRASALANPNSWLYVIDPAFTDDADAPQWAVVGAYPVNGNGVIENRFAANDTYRPSPRALGWPEPVTPLERTIQLAKAGHRPVAELPDSVLDATLLVYDPADGTWDGMTLIAAPDPHSGRMVIPACTSAEHVPVTWPGWRSVRGSDLIPLLRGLPLAINPDAAISAILPAELLTESARGRATDWLGAPVRDELRGRHAAD